MAARAAGTSRILMYAVGIVALFLMAAGIDRLVGPLFAPPGRSHHAGSNDRSSTAGQADQPARHTAEHSPTPVVTTSTGPARHDHKLTPERGLPWFPGGLQIAEDGYGILLTDAPERAGQQGTLAFQITGPDGRPVTAYTTYEKPLHLIVVRRDLTSYRHVHPVMSTNGTWRTPMTFGQPGTYRVLADFLPRGRDEPLTLGADLIVPGYQEPAQRPVESRRTTVDGYTAQVRGGLKQGELSRLTFTIGKNGKPVSDLQPYLGAYGHVVALRGGDLAYLHVHPAGTPGSDQPAAGPAIAFDVEVPSAGVYRLFLDFQHRGAVRTAAFTVTATR